MEKHTTLFEVRAAKNELTGEYTFQMYIPLTGEIREAKDIPTVLKQLLKEHGYYLRRIP